MDDKRFDEIAKLLADPASRRSTVRSLGGGALGVVLGLLGLADTEAGKKKGKGKDKKKKKKKKCSGSRKCGKNCCGNGQFCCDDARRVCCANGSECCNVGPGTGSCCDPPNRCGKPIDNDAAPFECCPPERQWFTTTGLVRCCPPGKRSLGTGITSDDGPCCPEAKYCSQSLTGGTCCPDGQVCVDPSTGRCCTSEATCGAICCPAATPVCVDPSTGRCCTEERDCNGVCCQADSGLGQEDGEVCTRDGCCPQVKTASNCRADAPNCNEKICCAAVWTQDGRGLACHPGAEVPPETRAYCCGPGKSCCFTGCCPEDSSCCGDGNCCPDADPCGSASCFAPTPDHV